MAVFIETVSIWHPEITKMPSATLTISEEARSEIDKSIVLSTFSMARLGLTYSRPLTTLALIRQKIMLVLSFFGLFYHIFSDLIFIIVTMSQSPRVEDVVPLFHTFGYGTLSKYLLTYLNFNKFY